MERALRSWLRCEAKLGARAKQSGSASSSGRRWTIMIINGKIAMRATRVAHERHRSHFGLGQFCHVQTHRQTLHRLAKIWANQGVEITARSYRESRTAGLWRAPPRARDRPTARQANTAANHLWSNTVQWGRAPAIVCLCYLPNSISIAHINRADLSVCGEAALPLLWRWW